MARRALLLLASVALCALAALLVVLTLQRAALPYDEAGRFFDAGDAVVYDAGAVMVYGAMAALAVLAAAAAVLHTVRLWRSGLSLLPDPVRMPPHPANVPGPFYVEDGCCITCGVWEAEAPDLLAWVPDADRPHCYVARQPETDAEFERMKAAMEVGEVDCIRVHNCRPDWAGRLRAAGLGHQIDPPEGPATR